MRQYFWNWLILVDETLNTLFGGSATETCSSRLGRYYGQVWIATVIANALNWFVQTVFHQANHCKISILPDDFHQDDVLK